MAAAGRRGTDAEARVVQAVVRLSARHVAVHKFMDGVLGPDPVSSENPNIQYSGVFALPECREGKNIRLLFITGDATSVLRRCMRGRCRNLAGETTIRRRFCYCTTRNRDMRRKPSTNHRRKDTDILSSFLAVKFRKAVSENYLRSDLAQALQTVRANGAGGLAGVRIERNRYSGCCGLCSVGERRASASGWRQRFHESHRNAWFCQLPRVLPWARMLAIRRKR